jgi:2'-5' RNA ligase superfamily
MVRTVGVDPENVNRAVPFTLRTVAQTGVVVLVPAVEPVVSVHRMRHDPMAAHGVPAHITILYPFRTDLDGDTAERIDEISRAFTAFDASFATVGRFADEGVVWLRPEPHDVFVALVRAFAAAFPECPPYGGGFAEVIPHLTVATGLEVAEAAALATTLTAQLPVTARVDRLTLLVEDDGGVWHAERSWPLGSSGVHGPGHRADRAESES